LRFHIKLLCSLIKISKLIIWISYLQLSTLSTYPEPICLCWQESNLFDLRFSSNYLTYFLASHWNLQRSAANFFNSFYTTCPIPPVILLDFLVADCHPSHRNLRLSMEDKILCSSRMVKSNSYALYHFHLTIYIFSLFPSFYFLFFVY